MKLTGKTALITGGGNGIGRAVALRLASEGANIALADIDENAARNVADEVRQLGRQSLPIACDVSRRDAVHAAVDTTCDELGGFDIMVNNAGLVQVRAIDDLQEDDLNAVMGVNINGVIWGIQAAAAKMRALRHGGKIINASSIAGFEGGPLFSVYCATKFAVRGLTHSAAQEYGEFGITVNSYAPGIVGTKMWSEIDASLSEVNGLAPGENQQQAASTTALRRGQTPDDVAALVSFLSGPDSDYITGQTYIADGGFRFI